MECSFTAQISHYYDHRSTGVGWPSRPLPPMPGPARMNLPGHHAPRIRFEKEKLSQEQYSQPTDVDPVHTLQMLVNNTPFLHMTGRPRRIYTLLLARKRCVAKYRACPPPSKAETEPISPPTNPLTRRSQTWMVCCRGAAPLIGPSPFF